jgi:hypothetical protein
MTSSGYRLPAHERRVLARLATGQVDLEEALDRLSAPAAPPPPLHNKLTFRLTGGRGVLAERALSRPAP